MLGDNYLNYLGVEQSPNNILQDRYDSTIFNDVKEASAKLRELINADATAWRKIPTWPALVQDFWATFYKANPELQDEERIDMAHKINRPFVERLLEDNTTAEARLVTMLDELSSALATIEAGNNLLQNDFMNSKDFKNAVKKVEQAVEYTKNGNEQGANQSMQEAQELLQANARGIRRAVREAIKAGKEKAEELQTALAGWGLEPGDLQAAPIENRLYIASKLTQTNLKQIADLVGRMRNFARACQRNKVKKERDEIYSITVGSDIHHALPVELALLSHPLRKLDFYRRFTEHQLLQYELQSKEKQARGPIICLVDMSGSMEGEPFQWAIAVALALVDTAKRQKRYAYSAFFNTEVKATFEFEPGKKNIEQFLNMATINVSGGTDYMPAINWAIETIERDKDYKNADILMITDGICVIEQTAITAIKAAQKKFNFKSMTILLGNEKIEPLTEWNDKVWQCNYFDENAATEIAGQIFEEVY